MKVLAIVSSYPPHHGGGQGLHFERFCEGLAGRGHKVQILTSAPGRQEQMAETSRLPIDRSLRLLTGGDMSPRRLLRLTLANRKAVRSAFRKTSPNVVFCSGMDWVGFNTYLSTIESGVPSLTYLGDTWLGQAWQDLRRYDPWADLANGGRRPGIRRAVKRAIGWYGRLRGLYDGPRPRSFGRVAAISQFVLDDLRRSGAPVPDDARLIPVGLTPAYVNSNAQPIGHSGTVAPHLRALFVGRMERLKGPDVAIKGLAVAVARGADVRLTFAGLKIDQARPELMAEASALAIADRITWAGAPSDAGLVDLYRNHDVFLFPSRIVEGLGVVNCEALACGLPVIGTADSGAADVIITGKTGFRIAIDDADAIGRHLCELHFDRSMLSRLSASAVEFAGRYLPDVVIDQLEEELLRSARRSPGDE